MAEAYLREVELPSKGLVYNGALPGGLVTITPMGTREEKMFASSAPGSGAVISKIFDGCVSLPFHHEELILGDRLHLLLQIRSLSYGNMYEVSYRCRGCGASRKASIDLDKLPVRQASEQDPPPFAVTLPILGHQVVLRLLTGKDEEKVRQYASQVGRHGDSSGAEYVYRLARRIVSIDGHEAGIREAMELVESLKGADSLALRDVIDEHDVGPLLDLDIVCDCGYDNELMMPFTPEFFRPRRRRPSARSYLEAAEAVDDAVQRSDVR